jgi:hypothetical protein
VKFASRRLADARDLRQHARVRSLGHLPLEGGALALAFLAAGCSDEVLAPAPKCARADWGLAVAGNGDAVASAVVVDDACTVLLAGDFSTSRGRPTLMLA